MVRNPPLDAEQIRQGLRSHDLAKTIHVLRETSSTNTEAFSLAESGASHGTVVIAEQQTAGHGRLDRTWFSPPFQNIYASLLLRQIPSPDRISWIPLMTGVAIQRAIEQECGLCLALKWPNDLLAHTRKIGGILCESTVQGPQEWTVVVGMGINVHSMAKDFPPDLQSIATSLNIETGRQLDRNSIIAAILSELATAYRMLQFSDLDELKRQYVSRCSTLGQQVHIRLATHEHVEGIASDIGPDGALRVMTKSGNPSFVEVKSGEILSVR